MKALTQALSQFSGRTLSPPLNGCQEDFSFEFGPISLKPFTLTLASRQNSLNSHILFAQPSWPRIFPRRFEAKPPRCVHFPWVHATSLAKFAATGPHTFEKPCGRRIQHDLFCGCHGGVSATKHYLSIRVRLFRLLRAGTGWDCAMSAAGWRRDSETQRG